MAVRTLNTWRCDRTGCGIMEETGAGRGSDGYYPEGWMAVWGGYWLCGGCYALFEKLVKGFMDGER